MFCLPNNALEIVFFDIGQGDSVFIKTPENHQILIDTGPSSMVLKRLSENMPFFDRSIDMIVLTHPDLDHIGGIVEIMKRYEVDFLLVSGVPGSSPLYHKFLDEISERIENEKTQILNAEAFSSLNFGEVRFDILYPFSSVFSEKVKDVNEYSVSLQMHYAGKKALFCGDISSETEQKLFLAYGGKLKSDLLKINHHGSKYSNSPSFIQIVAPEIAVISAGKENNFGHPHLETIMNLYKANVSKIFRTDEDGSVKIVF
ncbi:MAG: ComEC/Rec2 family competence protein [Candidatus Gracilibacteria bacterium]|nr:ComEC/Rec2 family competence protein [Candidatus Gracilibacteria bacterium]